ncbi:sugar ABC transporter permease [Curtobacterium sp. MCBD17_034]|uniref:carbohydrate ABC transporter permease n=1 Tax=unclassified Curtobacterium TaxID=257496 RepID=UPI000DA6E2C5|nr:MULTISPECIES: sugar ABC transporter permease [unclassified Curtobacterium]PZF56404.1 sugar ABC transporter permease [Curtobacterium sp. MCBD17_034]PZM33272.1 sugar ABC transporter permease [Curtobacterium sp. MCBD17_031]
MTAALTSTVARAGARRSAPAGYRQPNWLGYAFLSPALLLFIVFIAVPFVATIVLAFFSWDLLTPARPVGLANFGRLFTDGTLGHALLNTFVFAFASVVTHVLGAMLLAVAVNRAMNRVLSYFVRAAVFFPFLISWAAVALLWKYVLDPSFGYVQYYLHLVGVAAPQWFTDPHWALASLIGVDFWHTIGYTFVIMLAGLQTVPSELQEAARTDGASERQVFLHITLPLMSPTIFFATIITFIGAFQIFDPMQIITSGGPDNATISVVMYLYRTGFQAFQIGYASVIALVVFVVIMAVTALQFWASRKWVYEQ